MREKFDLGRKEGS